MTQPSTAEQGGGATGAVVTAAVAAGSALAVAAAARRLQLAIRAALVRDVVRLWPLLDPKRLDETWPGWSQAMDTLIVSYHGQSAVAAQRAYVAVRTAAVGLDAPPFTPELPPRPSQDWVRRSLGYAAPGLLANPRPRTIGTPAPAEPDRRIIRRAPAPDTTFRESRITAEQYRRIRDRALVATTGVAQRIAITGARDVTLVNGVLRDDLAVGWYRLTDANPCAFCALLAGRGIVYKSATVDFKAHDNCACLPQPAYSRDEALPEASQRAADLYAAVAKRAKRGMQLQAFRAAYEGRDPSKFQRD